MQQLKIEHNEEQEQNRECKGRRLAITRNVFHIKKTDSYYCQSEQNNSTCYYFIRYAPDKTLAWCSCPDNSMRSVKCKHIFCIEYALRLARIKVVDKLPVEVKKEVTKAYTEDDYSF